MKNIKIQTKCILCAFRIGDFCLLLFSIFLNSVYGWTAQNLVIHSKNFVQRIFFELLYRVYKTAKFLGYVLYECPSLKYVTSKCLSFIHPVSPVCLDTLLMTLRKLLCFISYLRADKVRGQCMKHNVWGGTYFWACLGTIFFNHGSS